MLRSITKLRGLTTLVAVSLLAASVAEAQQQKRQRGQRGQQRGQSRQRGGGFGGFGGQRGSAGALQLIGREEVRKELKITEEQQGIIRELQTSSRPNFRELLGNIRDLSREEREKKFAELRASSEKKSKEAEADLYGLILDEGQATRLKQIVLQQKGNRALTEPATAKALGLSAAQVTKIKAATTAGQKKQQELTAGLRNAFGGRGQRGKKDDKSKDKKDTKRPSREELTKRFADLRTKGEAIRAETDKAISAVLTAAQKTKFEELKGPKFELARRTRGSRGGNRGGSRKGQNGRKRPQRPGGAKKKRNEA
jgi:Spy/CpxP family protein refolding chaperone